MPGVESWRSGPSGFLLGEGCSSGGPKPSRKQGDYKAFTETVGSAKLKVELKKLRALSRIPMKSANHRLLSTEVSESGQSSRGRGKGAVQAVSGRRPPGASYRQAIARRGALEC